MSLNDEWRPSSHMLNRVGELPINAEVLIHLQCTTPSPSSTPIARQAPDDHSIDR